MSKPKTITANKPVQSYLTDAEAAQLKNVAANEMRTQSAMIRVLILEGLERRTNQSE